MPLFQGGFNPSLGPLCGVHDASLDLGRVIFDLIACFLALLRRKQDARDGAEHGAPDEQERHRSDLCYAIPFHVLTSLKYVHERWQSDFLYPQPIASCIPRTRLIANQYVRYDPHGPYGHRAACRLRNSVD